MGIQINGNTNNINAGIGSLSIEDINELDIVGVATAANFKTGVSNLHSVGLTLSGGQIDVGSNIKLGNAGVITATSFVGSGANLTGITGTTINNNTDNYVITGSGTANTLNAESTLRYDASLLNIISSTQGLGLRLQNTGNEYTEARFDAARTGAGSALGILQGRWNNQNNVCAIYLQTGDDTTNKDDGRISFLVHSSAGQNKTALRIEPNATIQLPNDSQKLQFGSDGVLNIWHGGSNGYIDNETGDTIFRTTSSDTERFKIVGSTGHIVIAEGLGIGGVDPGGSTLKVNGSLVLSQGGNTSWQKVSLEGSGGTSGDAISINNWGDAEGDYWMFGVNQTMNQSGNYSKTNSGKRTSFVTIDGRMGRVYLGGASTSGNPTEHFYSNWDGSMYMNAGFGSVAPFYGVRAWVQGNSGTTNASGGLSSMSRISTGRFRLNFATTMPDDNYATGCLANNNYDDTSWHGNTETTRVDVHFYTGSSYVDPSEWSAWVIR
jgi:hypothetical protein